MAATYNLRKIDVRGRTRHVAEGGTGAMPPNEKPALFCPPHRFIGLEIKNSALKDI